MKTIYLQGYAYQNWQPHPSQWPSQTQGHSTGVWQSQDRQWVQEQFPLHIFTSPPPTTKASVTRVADLQENTYTELQPMVNKPSFKLSALAREAGIPTDVENDD